MNFKNSKFTNPLKYSYSKLPNGNKIHICIIHSCIKKMKLYNFTAISFVVEMNRHKFKMHKLYRKILISISRKTKKKFQLYKINTKRIKKKSKIISFTMLHNNPGL